MGTVVLGIFLHFLGGFASGSFYIPFRSVRRWSWESYWLVGGSFSWLIVPFIAVAITVPDFGDIISQANASMLCWIYLFGVLWGIGGLTFGLTMRYLGLSLGMSMVMGLTSAFGSLMPLLYNDLSGTGGTQTISAMAGRPGGQLVLLGVAVSLVGIAICGWSGMLKDRELADDIKQISIKEFSLRKGIIVALISGVLSACFSYGISAGHPLAEATVAAGTDSLFQNNVTFMFVMWGGLTSNAIWCLVLGFRNHSFGDYLNRHAPLLRNYLFSASAGTLWFLQFFFYGMGESRLHNDASSWVLHMSFIIIVSNIWGLYFREWHGTSLHNKRVLLLGNIVILISIGMLAFGNYLG